MSKSVNSTIGTPGKNATNGLRPSRMILRAAALGVLGFVGVLGASSSGCSTKTPAPIVKTENPPYCVGGFIRTASGGTASTGDGGAGETCEALCSPSKCTDTTNVCVNNHCELPCTTELDCPTGQRCVAATVDSPDGGTGAAVNICQPTGLAPIGKACPLGTECKGLSACPDGTNCDFTQCGGGTCTPDPLCAVGSKCPIGQCADGTACIVQGCAQTDCKPLFCLTDGAGDANAVCTIDDCTADTNCPGGYYCDRVNDAHPICGAAAPKIPSLCGAVCTSNATCVNLYGTGSTCAETSCEGVACKLGSLCGSGMCAGNCTGPCVTPSTTDGTTYQAGPFCTTRNQCRPRGVCAPCTTDIDCSGTPGRHCVLEGTSSFCATDCGGDSDCDIGFQCTNKECVPRAGSCTGKGTFCEPCHNDSECSSGLYCGGETGIGKVCTLPSGMMKCTVDADCPASPSGLHGMCLDARAEVDTTSPAYHTCYLPFLTSTDSFQCWPGNTGAACGVGTDCISKSCLSIDPQTALGTCK